MQRLIVGITGATGAIFGVRLLQALDGSGIETHLVISKWALQTIEHEVDLPVDAIRALATVTHEPGNFNAPIASGSFRVDGMIIAPCSVRSLAAIAHGNGDTLIHRAADVILKERRRLVLLVREMPLSEIHLDNMLKLARMGATIMPPMPAFYNHPKTVEDIVDHVVARTLDQLDIPAPFARRWDGLPGTRPVSLRHKR
jgi:4-hydroxy-3-polyprenylbenzoate decarboxylase